MHICVIGGGVIGLFTAYDLVRQGHTVTLIDQGDFTHGTSFGNAGMICPSHFTPLAAPGIILQSIKWMFDDSSPFYIKPRLSPEFLSWCLQFFKHATRNHVENNIGPLAGLLNWSRDLYRSLDAEGVEMSLEAKGIIMVCSTRHALDEEILVANKANRLGIRTAILQRDDIQRLNPGVSIQAIGGVHYLDDLHLTPKVLMSSLLKILEQNSVQLIPNLEVLDFKTQKNKITHAVSAPGDLEADVFVLAGGAWTGMLSRKLGYPIHLQGGKGYNVTIPNANPILHTPLILVEGRVAVTPMGTDLRLGGTMELAGFNDTIKINRVQGILQTIESYLPDYYLADLNTLTPWYGYRPLTPTGIPIIGPIPNYTNGFINTGHGMLGLSLAPASAHLVTQLISNMTSPR